MQLKFCLVSHQEKNSEEDSKTGALANERLISQAAKLITFKKGLPAADAVAEGAEEAAALDSQFSESRWHADDGLLTYF